MKKARVPSLQPNANQDQITMLNVSLREHSLKLKNSHKKNWILKLIWLWSLLINAIVTEKKHSQLAITKRMNTNG
jgi:hypothetical protein